MRSATSAECVVYHERPREGIRSSGFIHSDDPGRRRGRARCCRCTCPVFSEEINFRETRVMFRNVIPRRVAVVEMGQSRAAAGQPKRGAEFEFVMCPGVPDPGCSARHS
ncbi:hypothetical protein EVAR_50581_1 [Eumeta japonica]|uniref:Uncharacterized protein n=1 Tax=Eumeta variegata TaxID=151549 RepID=A0A4C1Y5M4_EUMVA|nr:hypothetical protein EVAR_50581_1 [Eumeta japonica]